MERWQGRVALVTGASAGIGFALTQALVKHGVKVAGCARNIKRLEDLKDELKGEPGDILPIKCDLRNEADILAMFDVIKKQYGGVDICVNNAGLGRNAPLLAGATEEWRELLDVNVLAVCVCTREAVKSMRERKVDDGHVIHVSSMSGHRLTDKSEHFYACTKHAVKALTEGLRVELRELKSHIRITCISPGCVETEFIERMYSYDKELQAKMLQPGIKEMEAKDIVDAILYALSAPQHVQVHDILMRPTEQRQ